MISGGPSKKVVWGAQQSLALETVAANRVAVFVPLSKISQSTVCTPGAVKRQEDLQGLFVKLLILRNSKGPVLQSLENTRF